VRNLIIDLRQMPPAATATGLHWQVAQATSLFNVTVEMSTEPGNNHQGDASWLTKVEVNWAYTGIFMENGRQA
jgi:hypothetical protein